MNRAVKADSQKQQRHKGGQTHDAVPRQFLRGAPGIVALGSIDQHKEQIAQDHDGKPHGACLRGRFTLTERQVIASEGGAEKDEPLHDISMTCTGSSSVTTRKVLLLLTIQKKLGFKFAYTESPDIETVPQLVDAVMRHMAEARDGAELARE